MASESDTALVELELGGERDAWEAVGFHVDEGAIALGATRLRPTGGGGGIRGWTLAGVGGDRFDGLPTTVVDAGSAGEASAPAEHPNRITRIDHIVVRTPRFDTTVAELQESGIELRRVREPAPGVRQGFMWVGDTILELVSDDRVPAPEFWGLTLVSADLDATAAQFGDLLGEIRQAVQPGRRIATVRREAGLGVPVALMTPHVKRAAA